MSKVQEQEAIRGPVTPGHDIVERPRGRVLPRHWTRFLYIAPLMIILLSLVVFPIFYAIRYSFYDYYLTRGVMRFVGLQNYVDALNDTVFLQARRTGSAGRHPGRLSLPGAIARRASR